MFPVELLRSIAAARCSNSAPRCSIIADIEPGPRLSLAKSSWDIEFLECICVSGTIEGWRYDCSRNKRVHSSWLHVGGVLVHPTSNAAYPVGIVRIPSPIDPARSLENP